MRVVVSVAVLAMLSIPTASADNFGDCSGALQAELLDDGRKIKLLQDYIYTDPTPKPWKAPKNSVVDGASIPQFLWSFIGGPFEGLYRKASVVHDVECEREAEDWRAVHKMFFDAMRCSGVSEPRAKIMYAAVYHCGPRWGNDQGIRLFPCNSDFIKQLVRRWKNLVYEDATIGLVQLENMDQESLIANSSNPFDQIRRSIAGKATLQEPGKFTYISIPVQSGPEIDLLAASVVADIGTSLKNIPGITITVAGHTDSFGTAEMNQALSDRRAETGKDHLVAAGVDPQSVNTVAYGESRPVSHEDTGQGRQQNRRIEIIIKETL